MKLEHFIYGMFKNYGVKLIKSPGVNQLLDGETINYLCELKQDLWGVWPNGVVTITKVKQAADEYGRNGTWNHTLIIPISSLLEGHNFENLFILGMDKPPTTLPPLEVT